jgi:3-methyladenine DNA glycosylase AlkC
MSSLLKDLYSNSFYDQLSLPLKKTIKGFDKASFLQKIFTPEFQQYELKERMAHTAHVLNHFLPKDYTKAVPILSQLIDAIKKEGPVARSIEYLFIPEYIYLYGLDHYTESVKAMEQVTQFITCEFAIRHFIVRYEEKMIPQMLKWSTHKSRHVRRLATEGCRPRLPWAMALPKLKKDPSPILPILENLKQDTCEVVRRSVANNLNDISKDNPGIAIEIARKWKNISPETDAIIKHSLRTLLKAGHPEVLKYYQLDAKNLSIEKFSIKNKKVKVGDYLEFEATIINTSKQKQELRLEYAIYYLRNNKTLSKKVFKISERILKSKETYVFTRRQSFKPITTRIFYLGKQAISLIINGKEGEKIAFQLF